MRFVMLLANCEVDVRMANATVVVLALPQSRTVWLWVICSRNNFVLPIVSANCNACNAYCESLDQLRGGCENDNCQCGGPRPLKQDSKAAVFSLFSRHKSTVRLCIVDCGACNKYCESLGQLRADACQNGSCQCRISKEDCKTFYLFQGIST